MHYSSQNDSMEGEAGVIWVDMAVQVGISGESRTCTFIGVGCSQGANGVNDGGRAKQSIEQTYLNAIVCDSGE